MKKIALAALLMGMCTASYAETETCKQYFAEMDSFIKEASKHEEAKAQVDMLKNQLAEGRKQLETYSVEQQDAGCKQGLAAVKQLNASLGIK
ncbi:DUF5339 domain-containing protein [Phytobacter diazotrophicus]|uniref:DUF5339 domain-containing protein n=1 Tax=Phytobacter diazotrophicus TaxID=395631 RepID=UPI002935572A|nr:DUF5339 domain-containing protein [Phytobacter diazotrophicus]MBS6740544.1 DUF5339 domain-containing protein [Enterobacteriaceae bacterium]MDV2904787.1 DUF5339 domain-containing protein [Phytobacter diazotrophicus]